MSGDKVRIQLEPSSAVVEVPRGAALASALPELGVEFPCGGTALCGACRVRVLEGSLPITQPDRSVFSASELADGWRLACQSHADAPLLLECGQWRMGVLTDNSSLDGAGKSGLGIAVDLGTTTIAAQMIDLATGNVLGVETALNPQASFGSDVMSRIRVALQGSDLTTIVRLSLRKMIAKLASGREEEIVEVVLVGNTVMHHLFCSLDVEPLSRAPFQSPHLGAQSFRPHELDWPLPEACGIRFERCLGGFVGSDILAGILAAGISRSDDLLALVDLGTNGEIAIGNCNGIVCASTAAGPAFEAGSIRMGMRASTGAISRVSFSNGEKHATVIGDVEARGICGSGLVDAVAAGLESGAILPSGRIANGTKLFPVKAPVVLYQTDIRELQLAKAAIASGFLLLLKRLGANAVNLRNIYLAGAFGNYVQVQSAIGIGLLEAPIERIHASGNTALRGAKMLLLSTGEPALPRIEHVSLAADPSFQDEFAGCIAFPKTSLQR
ncbi:MAG: ASKHA domain-containing protein [Terracidiphilus sp.]